MLLPFPVSAVGHYGDEPAKRKIRDTFQNLKTAKDRKTARSAVLLPFPV